MSTLLPSDAEASRYIVGPGSVAWRRASDPCVMLGAGAALILQVAHPTIAGGVREHSDFQRDPWGRLVRTLDYVYLLVYGGSRSPAVGRALRGMHRTIRGVDPEGRRYHALEPRAYAWVHATLAHTMVEAHERFRGTVSASERERLWSEWRGLGRLLGIRERDLPADWASFIDYRDEMIATELEDNDVVRAVLDTLGARVPPPIPGVGPGLWTVARLPGARVMRLATSGLLTPAARDRLGLAWSTGQERELRALGVLSRAATPVMPRAAREVGPSWLRWRTAEIEHGPFAHGPAHHSVAA